VPNRRCAYARISREAIASPPNGDTIMPEHFYRFPASIADFLWRDDCTAETLTFEGTAQTELAAAMALSNVVKHVHRT
jgi:hypothetical protein